MNNPNPANVTVGTVVDYKGSDYKVYRVDPDYVAMRPIGLDTNTRIASLDRFVHLGTIRPDGHRHIILNAE